jgi:acyl-CoA-dependent ceramide synthase
MERQMDRLVVSHLHFVKPLTTRLKWQMFGWIMALQIINLFWYFLIWRVLLRALFSKQLSDERSDDEDETDKGKTE